MTAATRPGALFRGDRAVRNWGIERNVLNSFRVVVAIVKEVPLARPGPPTVLQAASRTTNPVTR